VSDLSRRDVRRKSLSGIFYLTSSSFANLLVGFAASLVLAHLLTPSDFGLVAVGSTALLVSGALADGGLAIGIVRRETPPTRAELRTLNGIQLALASMTCLPVALVALTFGRVGMVTAIMVLSLPISVLQTPGRVILYRQMQYDRQLVVDFGAQFTSQAFSVVAVILGAGVWGLATGSVVRALAGTLLIGFVSRRIERPSLRGWRSFGPLIRFGLSFQASWFTLMAREQSLNVVVGVVGGVAPLGIWTFSNRLFQLPLTAFNSLYVVGFPAMASLLARGEDPGPIVLRTIRRAAIGATFVFPTFAAATPQLVPTVFGEQWREVGQIIPFVCLSTLILGSIAVGATSYLTASGRPGVVALAALSLGAVWVCVTASLLPVIGITAIGLGNLIGAIVEAAILSRATYKAIGVSAHRPLLTPLLSGFVAGMLGWTLCVSGPPSVWIALLAALLTLAVNALGLAALCRRDFRDTVSVLVEMIQSTLSSLHRISAEPDSSKGGLSPPATP
jgi:polysaccharide transporter, PST family